MGMCLLCMGGERDRHIDLKSICDSAVPFSSVTSKVKKEFLP